MTTTNDFLPHATGVGANVIAPATWAGSQARFTGFQNGVADPALANTALRQGTTIASVIAEFMMDTLAQNIVDNGDVATLEAQFIAAIRTSVGTVPQAAQWHFGRDNGSVNVMTVPASPAITSYADGMVVATIPNFSNTTTTPTLSTNGLSNIIIINADTTAVAVGDISPSTFIAFMYDAVLARWRIISRVSLPQVSIMHRCADSGTKNAMTVATVNPPISAVTDGMHFTIRKGSAANDGALTLFIAGTTAAVTWGDGTPMTGGEWAANADGLVVYDSSPGQFRLLGPTTPYSFLIPGTKPPLLAPRTYYVNASTGSDSNDGLTTGTKFASIQHAIDVALTFNQNGFDTSIVVNDGNYSPFICDVINGSGYIYITGNITTPTNVLVHSTGGAAIRVFGSGYIIEGLAVQADADSGLNIGAGIWASGGGLAFIHNIAFNACVSNHMVTGDGSTINVYGVGNGFATAHLDIRGDAPAHMLSGGTINLGTTILNTFGNRTFSNSFVNAAFGKVFGPYSAINLGGSVTGKRYIASGLGIISTLGAGATYFPGTIAGTVNDNSVYL